MAIWYWYKDIWVLIAEHQKLQSPFINEKFPPPLLYLPPRRPPQGDENWCVTYDGEEKYLSGLSFNMMATPCSVAVPRSVEVPRSVAVGLLSCLNAIGAITEDAK